jgi:hypothetical protein
MALVLQPIMAYGLPVKVMRLETRVVDMEVRSTEEKETMVVNQLLASVESAECIKHFPGIVVD